MLFVGKYFFNLLFTPKKNLGFVDENKILKKKKKKKIDVILA